MLSQERIGVREVGAVGAKAVMASVAEERAVDDAGFDSGGVAETLPEGPADGVTPSDEMGSMTWIRMAAASPSPGLPAA